VASVRPMIDDVAGEIGPDAAYLRFSAEEPPDRRYLTGIELLTVAAVIAVTEFWKGVFSGAGKKVGESGSGWFLERLSKIVAPLRKADQIDTAELTQATSKAQQELDDAIQALLGTASAESLREAAALTENEQVAAVRAYLEKAGFPEAEAARHAVRICEVLRERLSSWRS
jgi:hypothetical protein